MLLSGILEEQNQNIISDGSSNDLFKSRTKRPAKVIHSESDSSTDGGSSTSSSSDEEIDDYDLGKSAYIADPNSPIDDNSVCNDQ